MNNTIEVTCSHCGKRFQRNKYKANRYPNSYCNDQCRGDAKRKRLIRICANCGKEYETTSKRNPKYCSKACGWNAQIGQERPYMKGRPGWATGLSKETDPRFAKMAAALSIEPPSRDELHQLYTIENLTYKEIGKRFGVSSSTSRKWVTDYKLVRKRDLLTESAILDLTDAGLTHVQIGKMHNCTGSFVSKLAKSFGITARVLPASLSHLFGHSLVAKDGHKVRSRLELAVDDWLYMQGIEHDYEPPIPGTNYRADFRVRDTYIEVWGMAGLAQYDAKRVEKIRAYHENRLSLISIYPDDFPDLVPLLALSST